MNKIFAYAAVAAAMMTSGAVLACDHDTTICGGGGLAFEVGAVGLTNGIGAVVGNGDEFWGEVNKSSDLQLHTNVDYKSDMCPGGDCGDGKINFSGYAAEMIQTYGSATGSQPGETIGVENASAAQTGIGFQLIFQGLGN
ncbi:hypothetical protein H6778_02795 [Candidatus Nomurabacteria bacterium]|nr:hypothetical protein [Candidatus Nomurabacteria bacterium]